MPPTGRIDLGEVTMATFADFRHAFAATFGYAPSTAEIDRSREWTPVDRLVAARAPDGAIVGTAGSLGFDLSLPGGRSAACAGITMVSVRADHRRRGLLTRMMTHLLDDGEARGEPFAALWASESPIYGRYGFGPAVPTMEVTLDRRHAALRQDGPVDAIRLVDEDEARRTFPAIHDRFRTLRGGLLSRSPAWWSRVLTHEPAPAGATGPLRLALLPDRGYVIYHLASAWADGAPAGTVHVHDLVALDPAATAALWRFTIDTDLARTIEVVRRAPDDPVLAQLVDPGRAQVTVGWPLYVRLLDLPAAVSARGYLTDGTICLEVADALRPRNAGRWRVTADDGSATCEPSTDPPDLALDAASLATVSLGGVRVATLWDAGLVDGTWEAVVRADRLLAVERAPVSDQMF